MATTLILDSWHQGMDLLLIRGFRAPLGMKIKPDSNGRRGGVRDLRQKENFARKQEVL